LPRAPSAGAYLVGNTAGGNIAIEPVDCHVGASSSKLQRHSAADPLLSSRDKDHLDQRTEG
jgi:hypothetical protein